MSLYMYVNDITFISQTLYSNISLYVNISSLLFPVVPVLGVMLMVCIVILVIAVIVCCGSMCLLLHIDVLCINFHSCSTLWNVQIMGKHNFYYLIQVVFEFQQALMHSN